MTLGLNFVVVLSSIEVVVKKLFRMLVTKTCSHATLFRAREIIENRFSIFYICNNPNHFFQGHVLGSKYFLSFGTMN